MTFESGNAALPKAPFRKGSIVSLTFREPEGTLPVAPQFRRTTTDETVPPRCPSRKASMDMHWTSSTSDETPALPNPVTPNVQERSNRRGSLVFTVVPGGQKGPISDKHSPPVEEVAAEDSQICLMLMGFNLLEYETMDGSRTESPRHPCRKKTMDTPARSGAAAR